MRSFSTFYLLKSAVVLTVLLCTSYKLTTFKTQNDHLAHPILFTLVVPPLFSNGTFGHQLETFGNHLTGMDGAPRGGDLCLMSTDGTVRFLTQESGFGVGSGEIQSENAIAVRQPCVHWNGTKALFSMVIGGPTKAFDQSYRSNNWQIYEVTNLAEVINGMAPVIVKVPMQPDYNNISPIYGSDGQIIFTSDAPLFEMDHTYPQLDEYESSATNTGIFKLDPSTGKVTHLTHSPSGDFDIHLAKDGRIISTRWEHLKRDQQADAHRTNVVRYFPINYESEEENAPVVNSPQFVNDKLYADEDGTPYEIFPEAFTPEDPTRDPNEPLHDFNEFLPWEITENGERHQTMNHIGRHEFGGVFQNGSKIDDPNLVFSLGNFSANQFRETVGSDAGIFQVKEDPRIGHEGKFYGTWSREFARFSSGRIFQFSLPIGANPQDMEIIDWTHPDIDNRENSKGHFRNPIMSQNGTMLASYTVQSQLFSRDNPYTFRLTTLVPADGSDHQTEHVAGEFLTGQGFTKEIMYWGDNTTPLAITIPLSEVDIAEITTREAPSQLPTYAVEEIEASVLEEEQVDLDALRTWMIDQNLALIAIRNATERDQGESQQPFNLRVPGGVESIPASGKVYDISHLQLFQADMIRSYGLWDFRGRRPLATPIHNTTASPEVEEFNSFDPNGPLSSVEIASDGSIAAFVPATRALTWQTVSPEGESIVRERQWLTFAPGEIRTCEGCHGINDKAHSGKTKPVNQPEALRILLNEWKKKTGQGEVLGIHNIVKTTGSLTLYKNFPNPFSRATTINFDLSKKEHVTITIVNVQGQVVKTLMQEMKPNGSHQVFWNGRNQSGEECSSGIYLCRISTSDHRISYRLVKQ